MNSHQQRILFVNDAGFSIIEFLIAISLGALLIAGAASVYLSNKRTFNTQFGLSRLQENARYVNYRLNNDIRMAGFIGCANQNNITVSNIIKNPGTALSRTDSIVGFDAVGRSFSPSLPANISSKAINGSDVLEIRMASSSDVVLNSDMNQTNNPLLVNDRLGIKAGDAVLISDCRSGDIFIAGANTNATAITHTVSNNKSNDLSTAYTTDANIMRFLYYSYYVKNTGRTNSTSAPIYALVRQNIDGSEDELAEGVEQMQITYGVDSNGDKNANQYLSASQVEANNAWDDVISVSINLLFATTENVSHQAEAYTFNGVVTTPTDRKLRRQWTTFINLRNRGLPS